MTKTEVDVLRVQSNKNKEDLLSMECNNKMLLVQDPDSFKQENNHQQDVEVMSEETESITLTVGEEEEDKENIDDNISRSSSSSDSSTGTEVSEIIQLQDDEEEMDDYQMMLNGYKRMDLKGESESDKDLIIYSLNESLQIHKEIVERIQNEKDDLEEQFEQEKQQEKSEFESERNEIQSKKETVELQVNKLESIYQNLLKELEAKKLEYRRMETRFYSHVKSIRSNEDDDLSTIYTQISHLFSQIRNLCNSIKSKVANKDNILELWWSEEEAIAIQQYLSPLDVDMATHLTEKIIVDIIVQDVLQTSIHPGVSLNDSFGKIHSWVKRRNTSWASRMKQQISSFIVKQSNEEHDKIEGAKEEIIQKILTSLSQVYNDADKIKRKVTSIVNLSIKLNLAIKCQENQIDIIIPPIHTIFDENTMIAIANNNTGDNLLLVITPQIVASGDHGFNFPAKVYCV